MPSSTPSSRRWLAALGVGSLLLVWEILALRVLQGRHILPTPLTIVRGLWDYRTLIRENTGTTLSEAAQGWLWGNAVAVALALVFVLVPTVEAALLRLAIASYCMPVIAIAPILNVVFNGDKPKVVLAALSVFFTTLVGTVAGLRATDRSYVDLVTAYGGGSWQTLAKVRLRTCLPSLFAALRIAAPAAVLGAVVGEYLGGTSGIGVAMINAEQALNLGATWTLAIWVSVLAGAGYAATSIVARWATPWARDVRLNPSASVVVARGRSRWYRAARSVAFFVLSIAVAVGLWTLFIKGLGLSTFFAKSPLSVWHFVTSNPAASANRSELTSTLLTTLHDAGFGYVAGTVVAVVLAMTCVIAPAFETAFMPIALALRSVPLVAMTPLIALAFGRGLLSVTLIAGIVTFFPTFVNVASGLRSAPGETILLMRAYDATAFETMVKVRVPAGLPSLFSSARIAAPGALLGAVLAEWLATGKGLGYLMLQSSSESNFDMLWAGVVLITVVSAAVYAVVSVIEIPVMRRFGAPV